jgi:hypothetical protein
MNKLSARWLGLAIPLILSIFLLLLPAVPSPRAQQVGQPTPATLLPEEPPPGWDQPSWAVERKHCIQIFTEARQIQLMTPVQRATLPPLPETEAKKRWNELNTCFEFVPRKSASRSDRYETQPPPRLATVVPTPSPLSDESTSEFSTFEIPSVATSDVNSLCSQFANTSPGVPGPFLSCPGASVSACTTTCA